MNDKKRTIVLASGNKGKLTEFSRLLADCGYEVKAQKELNVEEVPETGLSFVENAIIKARNASAQTGLPALSDDSGIEVDSLKGSPGIYSARFAGENCSDDDNNALLLKKLKGLPKEKRHARYQCILVFMRHANDPTPIIAQGSWEGIIAENPEGDGGFGYDPLFWLPSHQCTSAQLEKTVKNSISHRAIATQQLIQKIKLKS